jgi:hypothetical protein
VNEIVRERQSLVLVFEIKDGKPLSLTTELRPESVMQGKRVGKNAGRDALEFVLKNWNMKLTSKRQ